MCVISAGPDNSSCIVVTAINMSLFHMRDKIYTGPWTTGGRRRITINRGRPGPFFIYSLSDNASRYERLKGDFIDSCGVVYGAFLLYHCKLAPMTLYAPEVTPT